MSTKRSLERTPPNEETELVGQSKTRIETRLDWYTRVLLGAECLPFFSIPTIYNRKAATMFTFFRRAKSGSKITRKSAASWKPRLETLEDRCLLSIAAGPIINPANGHTYYLLTQSTGCSRSGIENHAAKPGVPLRDAR
jgi:hypothetical protein